MWWKVHLTVGIGNTEDNRVKQLDFLWNKTKYFIVNIMKKSANYQRTLQEILDSDDELPNDYVEPSYIPTYQDDTRFDHLGEILQNVSWWNKCKIQTTTCKDITIKCGILSKKDVLCLQCVDRVPTDTLLWFFKFMIYKDIQTNYNFLKSCLVPNYDNYFSTVFCNTEETCTLNETQHRHKIIIKK